MKINKENQRGKGNYGWLNANYSFSFSQYFNPDKMGFNSLRVINEDFIAAKAGFPKHGHKNLEIYSHQEQDLNRLQDEDIDFYLGIGRISLLPSTLIVKKIADELLLSAVDTKHKLTKNPSVQEFVSYPHMLISNLNLNTGRLSSAYNRGILDDELDKLGLSRNVNLVVPHFSTAPLLLKDSDFILSAPSKIIKYFENILGLRTFTPPISNNPKSEFYLAWHKLSLNKRQNTWFKEEIIDNIKF